QEHFRSFTMRACSDFPELVRLCFATASAFATWTREKNGVRAPAPGWPTGGGINGDLRQPKICCGLHSISRYSGGHLIYRNAKPSLVGDSVPGTSQQWSIQ